jgi:hypothetical protein
MEFCVPPDFNSWPNGKRLEWHRKRIEREAVAYDYLEKIKIISTKTFEELQNQLNGVRSERRAVEATLAVVEAPAFIELQARLDAGINAANVLIRLRKAYITTQFRRNSVCDKAGEADYLKRLGGKIDHDINAAEQIEGEIITYCERHGIDPLPFFRVDEELGNHRIPEEGPRNDRVKKPQKCNSVSDWIRRGLRQVDNSTNQSNAD